MKTHRRRSLRNKKSNKSRKSRRNYKRVNKKIRGGEITEVKGKSIIVIPYTYSSDETENDKHTEEFLNDINHVYLENEGNIKNIIFINKKKQEETVHTKKEVDKQESVQAIHETFKNIVDFINNGKLTENASVVIRLNTAL